MLKNSKTIYAGDSELTLEEKKIFFLELYFLDFGERTKKEFLKCSFLFGCRRESVCWGEAKNLTT
jgi:hypothetical protein